MQDPWVKFAKHSSIMFVKAIMALVSYFIVFGYLLHLPQCSAWKRGQNNSSFNGALFCRQNFALKTDILRKVKTFGEIQCAFVCLSENDCVAQTYCDDSPRRKNPKGTCYLHKNGVKNEENSARLVKSKRCTFQQYMDLDEVSCSRKCQNGMKCQYDYDTRKCQRRCEPPYTGIDCNQLQAISFRFTTLGAQGNSGPISTAEYVNTSLQGTVTLDKGVQIWRVPFTALYRLKVAGASGGNASSSGGKGAIVAGVLPLTKGTVLHLLIGQKGLPGSSGAGGGLCIPLLYVTNALVENYLCQGAISGLIDLKESSTSRTVYGHDEFYGASSRSIYNLWRESPVQKTGGTFGGNTTKTNVTYRCSLANCKVAFMH